MKQELEFFNPIKSKAFHEAREALGVAADELRDRACKINRTNLYLKSTLEQIEIHLRGIVAGAYPAKDCAEFLLKEFFSKKG